MQEEIHAAATGEFCHAQQPLLRPIIVRETLLQNARRKTFQRHKLLQAGMYTLRGFIHKEDRHARFPQTVCDACEALREPFAGRHHQIPIPPPETTVLCLRRFQIIKGRNVVGNMRVIADLRGLLGQHGFRVHPLCFSMIKDRPRGLHVRAVQ